MMNRYAVAYSYYDDYNLITIVDDEETANRICDVLNHENKEYPYYGVEERDTDDYLFLLEEDIQYTWQCFRLMRGIKAERLLGQWGDEERQKQNSILRDLRVYVNAHTENEAKEKAKTLLDEKDRLRNEQGVEPW